MNRRKIRKITDQITKKYKPEKIILYGSHAWGKPSRDSDIDLFIIKDTKKDILERSREVYQIIFDEGEAVDILVYTPDQFRKRDELGDPFIQKLVKSGKTLYAAK